jgi:hypothetical protein
MTCLDVPELREGFERSNLPEAAWGGAARLVDGMCAEAEVPPVHLGRFTEFSEVQAYRFPSGTPGVTDTYLLAVLDVGLVMMKEVGLLRKRTDSQFLYFSEFGNGTFHPAESIGGRGWGHMDIQAAHGSVPVTRFGWYFDERSSDPRHGINAAAGERDRILAAIERWQ